MPRLVTRVFDDEKTTLFFIKNGAEFLASYYNNCVLVNFGTKQFLFDKSLIATELGQILEAVKNDAFNDGREAGKLEHRAKISAFFSKI